MEEDNALQTADQADESGAMYEFINGEITFNDYLNRMDTDEDASTSHVADVSVKDPVDSMEDEVMTISLDDSDFSLSMSESDESEIEQKPKKVGRRGKKVQRTQLSRTLQAVMGQANVCYAAGDTETAVKMCLEIIKEEPRASEPFRTLANIYEEIGQSEKSLQMRLIAAHLGPSNKEEWLDLANILKRNNRFKNAVVCYTKAIGLDELNVVLYEERNELVKLARMSGAEDYGYHRLLTKLDPTKHGENIIYVRKKVAAMYRNDGKYQKAYDILRLAFSQCPTFVDLEIIELFVNVLVTVGKYAECLEILGRFCDIDVETETVGDAVLVTECNIPETLSVDLREKLIITLCHLDSFDVAKSLVDVFLQLSAEEHGDSFFKIASALAEKEQYEYAVKLLIPLTTSSNFNSTKLWFKLADCYKMLNQTEACRQCYQSALGSFPDDDEIKLKFCNELKAAGMLREAIDITKLSQNGVLIYERCRLYELLNERDGFVEAAWDLFRQHCREIKTNEDFSLLRMLFRHNKGLKELMQPHVPVQVDNGVTLNDEWDIFLKVCQIYVERKDYDLLQLLTFSLYLSFKFVPMRKDLRAAMLIACIYNGWWEFGFDLTKPFLINRQESWKRIWNILNVTIAKTETSRAHKFLTRFLLKNPTEDNALMLYANTSSSAGSYKFALNDYSLLYEKYQTPMLALLVALNMLHIACQKFTKSRHALVTQMIAFLTKYENLRGVEASQEIFYNIGRAFHQLELLPQAIFYYNKALASSPAIDDPMFDLKCDIAFNLHLIYLNSGQPNLANMYLQKYVVI